MHFDKNNPKTQRKTNNNTETTNTANAVLKANWSRVKEISNCSNNTLAWNDSIQTWATCDAGSILLFLDEKLRDEPRDYEIALTLDVVDIIGT